MLRWNPEPTQTVVVAVPFGKHSANVVIPDQYRAVEHDNQGLLCGKKELILGKDFDGLHGTKVIRLYEYWFMCKCWALFIIAVGEAQL